MASDRKTIDATGSDAATTSEGARASVTQDATGTVVWEVPDLKERELSITPLPPVVFDRYTVLAPDGTVLMSGAVPADADEEAQHE